MNIKVTIDTVADKTLVDSFCTATGWTLKLGIAKNDWLCQQLSKYVAEKGGLGYISDTTKTERTAYGTAVKTAAGNAKVIIVPPVVTTGVSP
jgi:hypothetical protein